MNEGLLIVCLALGGITFWAWVITSVISLAKASGL